MLFTYLLKVLFLSFLFAGYDWLFLRRKALHHFNRGYLLLTMLLSITLPLIQFSMEAKEPSKIVQAITYLNTQELQKEAIGSLPNSVAFQQVFEVIYLSIVFLLVTRLIRQIAKLVLAQRLAKKQMSGFRIVEVKDPRAPYSFFSLLFWNPRIELDSPDGKRILRHEFYHKTQLHSADILLSRLCLCMFWFNPFFYFFERRLKLIHEYTADEAASAQDDPVQYSQLLLKQTFGFHDLVVANSFFRGDLQKRIYNLIKPTTCRFKLVRKLIVIPIVIFCIALASFTLKENYLMKLTATSRDLYNQTAQPVIPHPLKETEPQDKDHQAISTPGKKAKIRLRDKLVLNNVIPQENRDDVLIKQMQAVPDSIESASINNTVGKNSSSFMQHDTSAPKEIHLKAIAAQTKTGSLFAHPGKDSIKEIRVTAKPKTQQ